MANRTFELTGSWPIHDELGNVVRTGVQIATVTGPYMQTTEEIPGDIRHYSREDMIKAALDMNFKTVHADKALPEAIRDLEEAKKTMIEFKKFADKAKAEADEANVKAEALMKKLEDAEVTRNGVFERIIQQISEQGTQINDLGAMLDGFMNDIMEFIEGGGEEISPEDNPDATEETPEVQADEAL